MRLTAGNQYGGRASYRALFCCVEGYQRGVRTWQYPFDRSVDDQFGHAVAGQIGPHPAGPAKGIGAFCPVALLDEPRAGIHLLRARKQQGEHA